MKKYNDDYFSVIDKRTGKKLLDCGEEADALAMVAFDPQNRTYTRNKFLMGPVVDVEIPKALPTSNLSEPVYEKIKQEYLDSMYPDIPEDGSPLVLSEGEWDDPIPDGVDPWNLRPRQPMQPVKKLPKGEGEPVIV